MLACDHYLPRVTLACKGYLHSIWVAVKLRAWNLFYLISLPVHMFVSVWLHFKPEKYKIKKKSSQPIGLLFLCSTGSYMWYICCFWITFQSSFTAGIWIRGGLCTDRTIKKPYGLHKSIVAVRSYRLLRSWSSFPLAVLILT